LGGPFTKGKGSWRNLTFEKKKEGKGPYDYTFPNFRQKEGGENRHTYEEKARLSRRKQPKPNDQEKNPPKVERGEGDYLFLGNGRRTKRGRDTIEQALKKKKRTETPKGGRGDLTYFQKFFWRSSKGRKVPGPLRGRNDI